MRSPVVATTIYAAIDTTTNVGNARNSVRHAPPICLEKYGNASVTFSNEFRLDGCTSSHLAGGWARKSAKASYYDLFRSALFRMHWTRRISLRVIDVTRGRFWAYRRMPACCFS